MKPKDTMSRVGKFLVGFFTGAVVLQTAESAAAAVEETLACPAEEPDPDSLRIGTCSEAA